MGIATLNRTRALRAQGTTAAPQRTSVPIEEHKQALQKQRREYEIRISHMEPSSPFKVEGLDEALAEIKTLKQAKAVLRDAARGTVEARQRIEALEQELAESKKSVSVDLTGAEPVQKLLEEATAALDSLKAENAELSKLLEEATAAPAQTTDQSTGDVPPAEAESAEAAGATAAPSDEGTKGKSASKKR